MMNLIHAFIVVFVFSISLTTKAENCIKVKVHGEGQPLILIPGLMSDGSVWQESERYLAKNYQVHTISIAGFANTAPCSFASNILPQVKAELISYIKQNKLQKSILIGHSLGAFLSYSLVIDNEQLFSAIIGVDGLPFVAPIFTRTAATQAQDMIKQANYIKNMYQHATHQQVADITKQGINLQATSMADQQVVINMAKKSDQETVASALHFLLTTDLREPLKQVKTPLLLIAAQGAFTNENDRSKASALYQQQIANVANAKLRVNSESRHFIMWDDNNWLMNETELFLQGVL